jgi:plasmid stabilization system protein ParE
VARRIELLPRAEKELAALPVAVQDQIIAKLEMLRDFPESGVPMFDAFEGYRALLAVRRSYRIVYRIVSADLLEVPYIRHCRQQMSLRVVRSPGT